MATGACSLILVSLRSLIFSSEVNKSRDFFPVFGRWRKPLWLLIRELKENSRTREEALALTIREEGE